MEMDIKTLEEEHGTLQSDIAGEAEYLHSLQHQIEKLEVNMVIHFCFLLLKNEALYNLLHLRMTFSCSQSNVYRSVLTRWQQQAFSCRMHSVSKKSYD